VLVGESIEVTYNFGEYFSHKGEWDVPLAHPNALNQAVTFKGRLVTFKDGHTYPVFEDFTTFGKESMFPQYSAVLDYIRRSTLICVVPYHTTAVPPPQALYEWVDGLPFKTPGVFVTENSEPFIQEVIPFSSDATRTKVTEIEWRKNKLAQFIPYANLDTQVVYNEEPTNCVSLKSIVNLKAFKIGVGSELLIFEDWIKPLNEVQPRWLSRCPDCNHPLKVVAFHLTCKECRSK
jgi:hypothetical protein